MRAKFSLIAATAMASGLPTTAWAYLLPAEAIIQRIANRRARLGFTTLVAEGKKQAAGSAPVKVRWLIRANEAYRIETDDGRGKTTLTTVRGRRFEMNGTGLRPQRAPHDMVAAFLVSTDRDSQTNRGLGFLLTHRIEPEVVSLARLSRRIAYVIGAKPWETERPQLWVDKELDVPLRLIIRDRRTGNLRDIRLLEYNSAVAGGFFPRRIEHYENGELIETTTFRRVELNVTLDESLFQTPR